MLNRIKINPYLILITSIMLLLLLALGTAWLPGVLSGNVEGPLEDMMPFIVLDSSLTPADCRKLSVMPATVDEARTMLPCRQMKVVQHWLNTMVDSRTWRAVEAQLGDSPGQPDLEDSEKRRQYFFGRSWQTHVNNNTLPGGACDLECTRRAIEGCEKKEDDSHDCVDQAIAAGFVEDIITSKGFENDLKNAFPRLMAVLIASENPTDRSDGGEEWWWELPEIYAGVADLDERRQMMRDDVNNWIQESGLWVFANAGTPDHIDELKGKGDFDFILLEVINFMYAFRDRPDLLYDQSIETLVTKRWDVAESQELERLKDMVLRVPADWAESNVPFSGQDYERELWFSERILTDLGFSETENHVLMTLAHYYLMNQWISNDHRGNLAEIVLSPPGWDTEDWFAFQNVALADWVRDAVARPMHSGFFEDNARPYHHYTFRALLTFASYAEDEIIRTEAENALHFLATKFAFQSLDGRRYTSMRRSCEFADELVMYARDGTAFGLGVLSGAYKWNDSPYGLKPTLEDGDACFSTNGPAQPACYWPQYTWKVDADHNDGGGGKIALNAEQLSDYAPDPGAHPVAIWAAFSNYEIPRPIHDFMLNKHDGYYARMMPKYDRGRAGQSHYRFGLLSADIFPRYFAGDQAFDSSLNNERTPEFYFAGNGFLNVSGGIYNPYYGHRETTYKIPNDPFPAVKDAGCTNDAHEEKLENYDYLSRPYAILTEVPAYTNTVIIADTEPVTESIRVYQPFGTGGSFRFDEANEHLPMMRGDSEDWFKSANIATYKNFSYGYRIRNTGQGLYAELGGQFPQDIPAAWEDCSITLEEFDPTADLPDDCKGWIVTREFQFGQAARFKLYDLRSFVENQGQTGFFLVTARVRKFFNVFWSTRVARGFWEVVPSDLFTDLNELEQAIRDGNDPDWFRLSHVLSAKDFKYRLVTSEEIVSLDQRYGAIFPDLGTIASDAGRVQGIIGVTNPDGHAYSLQNVFVEFMDNDAMNTLPLIDVKAVNPDYTFVTDDNGNLEYYACAQDGWLAVNNIQDGTYLFADARRGPGFEDDPDLTTPYWVTGSFTDNTPWGVACGSGTGGSWVPAPPANGEPEDCSDPKLCDGGGHDDDDDPNGDNPPGPSPDEIADLIPDPPLPTDSTEGLPGFFYCALPDDGGTAEGIVVTIRNQGNLDAGDSTTTVEFANGGAFSSATSSLGPGQETTLAFAIPESCYGDGTSPCGFRIRVDSEFEVFESNEANNIDDSFCLPAGG